MTFPNTLVINNVIKSLKSHYVKSLKLDLGQLSLKIFATSPFFNLIVVCVCLCVCVVAFLNNSCQ